MCLIVLSYNHHPGYRLILAANRDEFYDRPTLSLSRWDDLPDVYAGRDIRGQGTWMGVSLTGRIAAITNYRDPASLKTEAPSRGLLVSRFLSGSENPESYLSQLEKSGHQYNGFNLIAGDQTGLSTFHSRSHPEAGKGGKDPAHAAQKRVRGLRFTGLQDIRGGRGGWKGFH